MSCDTRKGTLMASASFCVAASQSDAFQYGSCEKKVAYLHDKQRHSRKNFCWVSLTIMPIRWHQNYCFEKKCHECPFSSWHGSDSVQGFKGPPTLALCQQIPVHHHSFITIKTCLLCLSDQICPLYFESSSGPADEVIVPKFWPRSSPGRTVHSEFFSQTLFDFKKSISGPIELKVSGKTLYAIL